MTWHQVRCWVGVCDSGELGVEALTRETDSALLRFLLHKQANMSRGILGVKADPKKQILFSFSARQGEEWPSDDSDSDYAPTKEEAEEHGLKR